MEFDQVLFRIENSTTVRLLRSDHASLALSFFHFSFKAHHRLQIPYSQLKELFVQFLDHLDARVQAQFPLPPQHYLDLWCDEQHRFLRKFYELDQDEPLTELTYDAERALEWMQGLEKKEFVGTQSRFFSIFENMKAIADQTETDPETRLAFLKSERKKLDEEIKQIQTTGRVQRMDATQIRERFLNLLDDSRRLISEFQLVEDIFKELTRTVKEQKLRESVNKGDILRQVLDAHDYLEESDQGKSFHAFWNFLISDESQGQLRELGEKVLGTPEISEFLAQHPDRRMDVAIRKLKPRLLQVGQKVLRSKFRLSEELRKLLHQKTLAENKRVLERILEIKKLLLEDKTRFLRRAQRDFIDLDGLPSVQLPLLRPLWKPDLEARFAAPEVRRAEAASPEASDAFDGLFQRELLSEIELEARIQTALAHSSRISLGELVRIFPIEQGSAEVILYLMIAAKNERHHLNPIATEVIPISSAGEQGYLTVPQTIFTQ